MGKGEEGGIKKKEGVVASWGKVGQDWVEQMEPPEKYYPSHRLRLVDRKSDHNTAGNSQVHNIKVLRNRPKNNCIFRLENGMEELWLYHRCMCRQFAIQPYS